MSLILFQSQKSLEITSVAKAHLNAPNLISNKTHSEYKVSVKLFKSLLVELTFF